MRVPLEWLLEYCDPGLDVAAIEERLTMTGTKVEAVHRDALGAAVIELEVTPNRPDCLGVYGVARELHAATGAPLADPPWAQDPGSAGPLLGAEVSVRCPELCPRFTARVFEDVSIGPSPPWLKARLTAAGQRPIDNVVDITNYAMLLTGQPLHAFDLDRVAGARLTVRRASDGERVITLDGQERTLDSEMVVIEDGQGPTSIAGVMGGSRSEVGEGTTRVLLEVASWHGPGIHHASWALGLRSEASSRFEKGLAPEQCLHAQAVATRLMIELCGASLRDGTIDVGGEGPPPARIRLRSAKVRSVLGVSIPVERQREILEALDFEAAAEGEDLLAGVPPLRRNDVTREADLIEEVARIDGLEKLPASLPARRGAYGMLSVDQRLRRRAVDALVGRGLYETVGWSFCSPALADRLRLADGHPWRRRAVALQNPLSEEQSLLRPTLLCSLLDSAALNRSRGEGDLRLFEVGTVFAKDGGGHEVDALGVDVGEIARQTGVAERRSLAVLLHGRVTPRSWQAQEPPLAGLFAAKGVLEALCKALRVSVECVAYEGAPDEGVGDEHVPDEDGRARGGLGLDFLHPGRRARLSSGGREIGWLGELHPLVAERWELGDASADGAGASTPAVFELDLDALLHAAAAEAEGRSYADLISFPALRRDLAVTLPEQVPAAEAIAAVKQAAGPLLADAHVFDVYSGPQVGEGRRSLALSLSFRAPDRTLSEQDVTPLQDQIVAALEGLGGQLRG
jgi:phenylalanyl-tRNA synthetase beta chain